MLMFMLMLLMLMLLVLLVLLVPLFTLLTPDWSLLMLVAPGGGLAGPHWVQQSH